MHIVRYIALLACIDGKIASPSFTPVSYAVIAQILFRHWVLDRIFSFWAFNKHLAFVHRNLFTTTFTLWRRADVDLRTSNLCKGDTAFIWPLSNLSQLGGSSKSPPMKTTTGHLIVDHGKGWRKETWAESYRTTGETNRQILPNLFVFAMFVWE